MGTGGTGAVTEQCVGCIDSDLDMLRLQTAVETLLSHIQEDEKRKQNKYPMPDASTT